MAYRLPPLPALRAFEAAARHLSFKKAAEELHVTPAAVSQQIRQLEEYLGVVLFRRLTRAIELTAPGMAMLPALRQGFNCIASAVDATRDGRDGPLTVHAPPSFASRWLVPRLPRLAALCPTISLNLVSDDDHVDREGESSSHEPKPFDPRSDSSEIAIRYGRGHYPGLRVDKIFSPHYVPVCSPRLLTGGSPLREPGDLRDQVLIHDGTIADEDVQSGWAQWLAAAGVSSVNTGRGLRFSNAVLAVEAALDGQGVALALSPLVEADIEAGRLVRPFTQTIPSPYAYWLVMPEMLVARPAVSAFADWILAEGRRTGGFSMVR